MRSGFLALCVLLALPCILFGQNTAAPSITQHPAGLTAYVGESVTLTAGVQGTTPLSYQWYRNSVMISGATTTSYTIPAVALTDLAAYHLTATNAYGTAQTLPALVNVVKRPQTLTFAPPVTAAVAGSSVTLNAASSANLPVSFTLVSGAATLSGNLLTGSGGNVVVRATQAGNDTFAAAEPVENVYTFVSGSISPFITSPPADQTVTAGSAVTFHASAIGTPAPSYQWQKDGENIAGATTLVLTLPITTVADAGRYTIVATNISGNASASATLVVRAPPSIATAPVSQSVFAGDSARFSVVATGVPAPTYQWRKNSIPISGATNATLNFASTAATDAGRFEVVVTNLLGSVTSPAATLTVTVRDLAGTYFGRFNGTSGEFALLVRADRSGVFLAHLPALQTGITVTDVRVDLSGTFTANTTTTASRPGQSATFELPDVAAAPQPVTLRGTINDTGATVTGTVAGLNLSFDGARAGRSGTATTLAGLYRTAVVGTTGDRGFLVVAPDAQSFFMTTFGSAIDSARGTLDASGRFAATSVAQSTVDLAISNGAVTGALRNGSTTIATIAGASEARIGSEHLANLSVRTVTSPGTANLISGFVVTGTASKQVLIRAAGPALALPPFNIANTVGDPTLQLFRGTTQLGQNDDWSTPAANATAISAAATRAGAFPFRAGSQDAALLMTLAPGAYSVVVGGGAGTALAEVYEVLENNEAAGARRLVNVSARGIVTPNAPFIAGFVIGGTGPQRVLIRGVGPTLGAPPFNVAGTLPNPQLALFRGTASIKTNDDWFRDPEASAIRDAGTRAGAFALGASSLDAAILIQLEPGAYTAQISAPANANPANATGIALVEIYDAAP